MSLPYSVCMTKTVAYLRTLTLAVVGHILFPSKRKPNQFSATSSGIPKMIVPSCILAEMGLSACAADGAKMFMGCLPLLRIWSTEYLPLLL